MSQGEAEGQTMQDQHRPTRDSTLNAGAPLSENPDCGGVGEGEGLAAARAPWAGTCGHRAESHFSPSRLFDSEGLRPLSPKQVEQPQGQWRLAAGQQRPLPSRWASRRAWGQGRLRLGHASRGKYHPGPSLLVPVVCRCCSSDHGVIGQGLPEQDSSQDAVCGLSWWTCPASPSPGASD